MKRLIVILALFGFTLPLAAQNLQWSLDDCRAELGSLHMGQVTLSKFAAGLQKQIETLTDENKMLKAKLEKYEQQEKSSPSK